MVDVTVVVEGVTVVVVEIPVVFDTGVVVGSLQFSATKRKIMCLLHSNRVE